MQNETHSLPSFPEPTTKTTKRQPKTTISRFPTKTRPRSRRLMGCLSKWTSARTSALVLVAVNCVLLAGGVLVLYLTLHVRGSAWVDVVRSYFSSTNTILTAIELFACACIALAVLGSVAAICRWRVGLLIYSVAQFVLLIAFTVVATAAFLLRSRANSWETKAYPATSNEESVKREFDLLYCTAQGDYICNSLPVTDAIAMFAPQLSTSPLLQSLSSLKNITSLCGTFLYQIKEVKQACDGCASVSKLKNLSAIFDWANDKCPRTQNTVLWCGTLLQTGSANTITVGTAPYTECRVEFLDLVERASLYLGLGSLVVCIGALAAIGCSCYLRRQDAHGKHSSDELNSEDDGKGTPKATNAMYTKV